MEDYMIRTVLGDIIKVTDVQAIVNAAVFGEMVLTGQSTGLQERPPGMALRCRLCDLDAAGFRTPVKLSFCIVGIDISLQSNDSVNAAFCTLQILAF